MNFKENMHIQTVSDCDYALMNTPRQGVEQEFTLGKRQVPAGLEDGVRNMKAGGERMLFVPPEMGWTGKYRAAALQQIKSCGGTKCPLDEQPVIVFVKLEGYKKSECLGVGDLPISADVDTEKATISITIGSDACPEGNVEASVNVVRCQLTGLEILARALTSTLVPLRLPRSG